MQIIKVPLNESKTPNLILSELKNNFSDFSKLNLEEIHLDNRDKELSYKLIYENSLEEFERQDKIIFLGGDYSIRNPILNAFSEIYQNCFIIIFDAHIHDIGLIENLLENGVKPENILFVGLRKISFKERSFLIEKKIRHFSDIPDLEGFVDGLTERANGKNLYVSIDFDALEPAFAPGVSNPEPLGFNSKEFLYILRRIFITPGLKAFDLLGISSNLDEKHDFRSIKLASKIIQNFLE